MCSNRGIDCERHNSEARSNGVKVLNENRKTLRRGLLGLFDVRAVVGNVAL